MRNVLLAEPSLIPVIGLAFLLLLALSVAVAAIIAAIRNSTKKAATPPASSPDATRTQVIRRCPKCGTSLKSDVPEGLCPACLLQHGIATEGGVPPGTPPFTPPPLAELVKLFPQLEILEVIGQGGMGAVYKARQPSLDRFVALKILAPRSGGDLDFAGRFTREARALAKLSHPNIVAVYDYGQIGNPPPGSSAPASDPRPLNYFIMEYVDGPNLRQIEKAGKLTPREALQIIPQICAALQFAHDEGVVHRDIKPENVLLDKKGRVKIADFGLAKILGQEADFRLTGARDVMGTPHYMAPEQVEKPQEVDHRADIYSLGVVFYEMLTGELPLGKFDPPSHKVQIDVRLDDVVLRSLANNPDRRYQHVSEIKTEVETINTTPSVAAASLAAGGRPAHAPRPFSSAQTVALTIVNILLALMLVTLGWAANWAGIFFNVLFFFILLMVPLRVVVILWHTFQGSLEYRLWRTPLSGTLGRYWLQIANRWIFWLLAAAVLGICMVPPQFAPSQYAVMRALYLGGVAVLILLELLPARRLRLATNIAFAIGSVFMLGQLGLIYGPESKAGAVVLSMPVRGEWLVVHGGRSHLINNHYPVKEERDAIDMEKLVNGRESSGDPRKLESYPSWGQTLYAPADGKIAVVENNLDDNIVGETDRDHPVGNHICLDIGESRFVLMAHLQKGSILVSPGDVVHAGQPLAKCGNSGSTSHPHLHIQVQNAPRLFVTGQPEAQTFPILFRDAARVRGGHEVANAPFFVRRNDRIVIAEENIATATPPPAPPAPSSASAETWAPTLAPGAKPDLPKILEEAADMTKRGQYEEALGRYIWFHNHEQEYGDSYQDVVRITSAISGWVELGRRYLKADEALLEIRDDGTRKIRENRGYVDLFKDVQAINRELQEQDATYALYQWMRKNDPQLARGSYFWVESLLVSKGEYQWCFENMGNPQFRFDSSKRSFEMEIASQKQMAEMQERSRKQIEESSRKQGTFLPVPPPNTSLNILQSATNRFVGAVGMLIEIMIGTGHSAEAGQIRDQALGVIDDPRLKSAISDAQERIQKRTNAAPAVESDAAVPLTLPVVVETFPISGARDVPAGETEIRVRFSERMKDASWSWSTAWENSTPEMMGAPGYLKDERTCAVKVRLEAGRTYAWWLNSETFHNFKDQAGHPAVPYLLIFQTKPN